MTDRIKYIIDTRNTDITFCTAADLYTFYGLSVSGLDSLQAAGMLTETYIDLDSLKTAVEVCNDIDFRMNKGTPVHVWEVRYFH